MENASLRESLSAIQKEFVSLLNEQQNKEHKTKGAEGPEDFGSLSSGHFQMPYDIVRDGELCLKQCQMCGVVMCVCGPGIEKTFRDNLQRLREQLQKSKTQSMCAVYDSVGVRPDCLCSWCVVCHWSVCREGEGEGPGGGEAEKEAVDVAALQNKLSDYRDIIGQQEELLQVSPVNIQ